MFSSISDKSFTPDSLLRENDCIRYNAMINVACLIPPRAIITDPISKAFYVINKTRITCLVDIFVK